MPFVDPAPTPAAPPAARPPRDVIAVTKALGALDDAIAQQELATKIAVPSKLGSNDAYDAAVAKRKALLEPAAATIKGVIEVLSSNGGYRSQPTDSWGMADPRSGYQVPYEGLGDNAHEIGSISEVAAKNPVKFKWVNDFPWQNQPKTDLAEMVEIMRGQAGHITRGEAKISIRRVTDLTANLLYDKRADQLDAAQLQQLQDTVMAVRSLGTSRFADDALRGALEVLPREVLVDGKLTSDAASLAALEQMHRTTVVDTGSERASLHVAEQLEKAKQLAAAGDTAAARDIYESLTSGSVAVDATEAATA